VRFTAPAQPRADDQGIPLTREPGQ
jgi:hypothetical protein